MYVVYYMYMELFLALIFFYDNAGGCVGIE